MDYLKITAIKELVSSGYREFLGDSLPFSIDLVKNTSEAFTFRVSFSLLIPTGTKDNCKLIPCTVITDINLNFSPFIRASICLLLMFRFV